MGSPVGAFSGALQVLGSRFQQDQERELAHALEQRRSLAAFYEKAAEDPLTKPEYATEFLKRALQIRALPIGSKLPQHLTDLNTFIQSRAASAPQQGQEQAEPQALAQPQAPTQQPVRPPAQTGEVPYYLAKPKIEPPPYYLAQPQALPAPPSVGLNNDSGFTGPTGPQLSPLGSSPSATIAPPLPPPPSMRSRMPASYGDENSFRYSPLHMDAERQALLGDRMLEQEQMRLQYGGQQRLLEEQQKSQLKIQAEQEILRSKVKEINDAARSGLITEEDRRLALRRLLSGGLGFEPTSQNQGSDKTRYLSLVNEELIKQRGYGFTSDERIQYGNYYDSNRAAATAAASAAAYAPFRFTPAIDPNGVPTFVSQAELAGGAARSGAMTPPIQTFDPAGNSFVGGRQGISRTIPQLPKEAREQVSGMNTVIGLVNGIRSKLDKYANILGPVQGRFSEALYKIGRGELNADPEATQLFQDISNLQLRRAFEEGGKQLTGTERDLVFQNLPDAADTVQSLTAKLDRIEQGFKLKTQGISMGLPKQQSNLLPPPGSYGSTGTLYRFRIPGDPKAKVGPTPPPGATDVREATEQEAQHYRSSKGMR